MVQLKVKRLTNNSKLPRYAHPGDAGMDLFTPSKFLLKAGERKVIELGISAEFPEGYMIEFRDKSGLAAKHGITILGGILDAGYRGEWMVTLLNTCDQDYQFEKHEKIAQAVLTKIDYVDIKEVKNLSNHSRGLGGLGSTGKF